MTNEEAKNCLSNRSPVVCGGIVYDRISAIIYRVEKNTVVVKLELTDEKANSVTITDIKNVSAAVKV